MINRRCRLANKLSDDRLINYFISEFVAFYVNTCTALPKLKPQSGQIKSRFLQLNSGLILQHILKPGERVVLCAARVTFTAITPTCCSDKLFLLLVFVVVAEHAQQLPVATISRVIVVVVISVVYGQLTQVLPSKGSRASPAHPGVHI